MDIYDRLLTTREHFDMAMVVHKINDIASTFSSCWRKGDELPPAWPELCRFLSTSKHRYHQARFGDVQVLTGESAGRVLITFQKGDRQITLIAAADEPQKRCGVQSIHASPHEAQDMVNTVLDKWEITAFQPNPEGGIA